MSSYLLTLVVKNDLDEKARKEIVASVTKQMGKVDKVDEWGIKDLAYPIKRQTKGHFVHFEFESDPSTISSLDKSLKVNEDILRYLLVRA